MIIRDEEGRYIIIKESIFQEVIKILNVCASNSRASKCMRQKLTEVNKEIDKYTVIIGDFNTTLSVIDKINKQNK